jgi:hypothetical protein
VVILVNRIKAVKRGEMDRTYSTNWENGKCVKDCSRKTKKEKSVERPRRRDVDGWIILKKVSKVKQSLYTPWRRLGVKGGIAPIHSRPRH